MPSPVDRKLPASIGFFLGAGALSLSADQFVIIALSWLLLERTGSSALLGAVLAVSAVPRAVLMPAGGVLADRHGPRRMLRVAAAGRGLLVATLAGAFLADGLWAVWPLAFALGTAAALYYPAETSLLPRMLESEQLQRGNGLNQTVNQLGNTVAPAVAGVAVAVIGGATALAVAAAAYLAAAALLRGLPAVGDDGDAEGAGPRLWGELRSSLATVADDRGLRWLLVVIAVSNVGFVGPFFVGLPTLVREELTAAADAYGGLVAAFGGGAALGSLAAAYLGRRVGRRPLVLASGAGLVALFGCVAWAPSVLGLGAMLVGAGLCSGVLNVLLVTLIQLRSPQAHVGKVMSLVMTASLGLAPLSQALAGVVAGAVGARGLFAGAAALMGTAFAAGAPTIQRLAKAQ